MMLNRKRRPVRFFKGAFRNFVVVVGAGVLALALLMILPLLQTLTKPPTSDLSLQSVDTAKLDAPEPPPEPEPEKEPEPEEEPPKLQENMELLDISQLEVALNPGFGDGLGAADFTVNLSTVVSAAKEVDALFSVADLDQKPRVVYQASPVLTKDIRKKAPGTVYIIFVVNEQGRVESAKVQKSTDPVFDNSAMAAVKKWKFEPGKRSGKAVRFRMRVPISFPKG